MSIKILVVEDEVLTARDLQDSLQNLGYEVVGTAATGSGAVEKAKKFSPDLVLMDIILKGEMDGIQAAEEILRFVGTPVVYLTSHVDENTLERAKITQPYGYVLKPFQEKELHITLQMAYNKHAMDRNLREKENWLTVALKNMEDGVIATDIQGRITFINSTAASMLQCTEERALGDLLWKAFPFLISRTSHGADHLERIFLQEEFPRSQKHTWLTRTGQSLTIEQNISLFKDHSGKSAGMVLFLHPSQRSLFP